LSYIFGYFYEHFNNLCRFYYVLWQNPTTIIELEQIQFVNCVDVHQ
jgi:hypothetical protein